MRRSYSIYNNHWYTGCCTSDIDSGSYHMRSSYYVHCCCCWLVQSTKQSFVRQSKSSSIVLILLLQYQQTIDISELVEMRRTGLVQMKLLSCRVLLYSLVHCYDSKGEKKEESFDESFLVLLTIRSSVVTGSGGTFIYQQTNKAAAAVVNTLQDKKMKEVLPNQNSQNLI